MFIYSYSTFNPSLQSQESQVGEESEAVATINENPDDRTATSPDNACDRLSLPHLPCPLQVCLQVHLPHASPRPPPDKGKQKSNPEVWLTSMIMRSWVHLILY